MSKLKKVILAALLAILAVAVLGVGYFDTYPTYFAQRVTLSMTECDQVATLVAAQAYVTQNPGQPIPKAAQDNLDKSTRLAKRVAKYIMDRDPEILTNPPSYIYIGLNQNCQMAGGNANLK